MVLSDLLKELQQVGIAITGSWTFNNRTGIYLGDPKRYFPYTGGHQYPVECKTPDPELTSEQVASIRRRFGIAEG